MLNENSVVLIDGYAMIYRSFHAIPASFTSPAGQPTNALYGMARFFLNLSKLSANLRYGALVLDKGRCQKRLALLPEYKAQRPPMPDAMRSQIPLIKEWAEALGWPIWEHEGIEADDLIAGACLQYGAKKEIAVVSFDKDLAQLVNDNVFLLQPGSKESWKVIREQEVIERYGLTPSQICDYLCMLGDNSDNIPGLPGVGEKGAAKLLQAYGSIDGIYQHLDELSKGMKDKFLAHRDLLEKNYHLIVLNEALPPELKAEERLCRKAPNLAKLHQYCKDYGFSSLLKFFPNEPLLPEAKESIQAQKPETAEAVQLSLF